MSVAPEPDWNKRPRARELKQNEAVRTWNAIELFRIIASYINGAEPFSISAFNFVSYNKT
jgi:hypothetical protein